MPPILLSRRLRLRPPKAEDLENIYRLGSSPQVMRFITSGRTQNREEAKEDLEKRMASTADPLGFWIAEVKATGAFVGWMALKPLDGLEVVEVGYRFLEEFWGYGYATEGGYRILDYGFRTLNLDRIAAVAVEENRASIRVMEKLGMRFIRNGVFYGVRCVYYEIRHREFVGAER